MQSKLQVIIIIFLFSTILLARTVTGVIRDQSSGEPIARVNILSLYKLKGTTTDSAGNFVLEKIPMNTKLRVSHIAYQDTILEVKATSMTILLSTRSISLDTVSVIAQVNASVQPFNYVIEKKIQNRMPFMFNSIYQTIKILPGVTSNNEMSNRYNVHGGNFDENLFYINGIEVFHPVTIRKAMHENVGLANPSMLKDYLLYTGGLEVYHNDKLSSVNEVEYFQENSERFSLDIHASLLDFNLAFNTQLTPTLQVVVGMRYAGLSWFYRTHDLKGDYSPRFYDAQVAFTWHLNSRLTFQGLTIQNVKQFDLLPSYKRLKPKMCQAYYFDYMGQERADFNTYLYALKTSLKLGENIFVRQFTAFNRQIECNKNQIKTAVFKEYYQFDYGIWKHDNDTLMYSYEYLYDDYQADLYNYKLQFEADNRVHVGIEWEWLLVRDTLAEFKTITHEGLSETIHELDERKGYDWHKAAAFASYRWNISPISWFKAGIRACHSGVNDEMLVMPRVKLHYQWTPVTATYAGIGLIAQPPEYKQAGLPFAFDNLRRLKSQRSVEYVAGIKHLDKTRRIFKIEAYYKDLYHLISYYIDDLQLVYSGRNDARGYGCGLDCYMGGNLVANLYSWITYSYLISRENVKGDGKGYIPRPTAQTHTLTIFAQDQMRYFPEWKTSLKFVVGSGFPNYHKADKYYSTSRVYWGELPFYFNLDVGILREFTFSHDRQLILSLQILNIYDRQNIPTREYVYDNSQFMLPMNNHLLQRTVNVTVDYNF